MRLAYFPDQVAFNGRSILGAFLESAKSRGISVVENTTHADAAVIWSVLWNGRLLKNQAVFNHFRKQGKPVFILEVGALRRGHTWKVSLNNTVADGIYGQMENLDITRPERIGIGLSPIRHCRKEEILVACQHSKSHQWTNQPPTAVWLNDIVKNIRKYTQRPIIVRPHPRNPFFLKIEGTTVESPKKIPGSHHEYDLNYDYHCIINHNSGPSTMAPIQGSPIVCDSSSLASPMSGSIENIETIGLPDRHDWFLKICHTEWTEDEIRSGIPLNRLFRYIDY